MGRPEQLFQYEQEQDFGTRSELTDLHKTRWQKPQRYVRSNGSSIMKIMLTLAALIIGGRFIFNSVYKTKYNKVCLVTVMMLENIDHPKS